MWGAGNDGQVGAGQDSWDSLGTEEMAGVGLGASQLTFIFLAP